MSRRTVLVVGNFDGVHLGHQALFRRARDLAAEHQGRVVAVTFDQHPIAVLRPDQAPPMIMQHDQRQAALHALGVDEVEWLSPTRELLQLTPSEFVETLVDRFDPFAFVEGPNFRFGHRRAGDPNTLRELGQRFGFQVDVLDMLTVTLRDKLQANVSSSLVRWLIGHGRVADATICLNRPFALMGTVVEGEKRGRQIGYPTANLDCGNQIIPCDGVYAGRCIVEGQSHLAAMSIGHKPTFGQVELTVEAFLLDFDGDLYGQRLEVTVERFIRDQYAFGSVDNLIDQMDRDVMQTRTLAGAALLNAADLAGRE